MRVGQVRGSRVASELLCCDVTTFEHVEQTNDFIKIEKIKLKHLKVELFSRFIFHSRAITSFIKLLLLYSDSKALFKKFIVQFLGYCKLNYIKHKINYSNKVV